MTIRTISQILKDTAEELQGERISMDDVLLAFHERGFGFLILLFSIPMGIPVPVPPGTNIILALPLMLLTSQQAVGRKTIWVPHKLRHKTIARDKFMRFIHAAIPWLEKLEVLLKPRLGFITQGIFSNIIGVLGLFMTMIVCIPVPMTNTVPSMGIALMALGVIMRDGLAVIAGAIIGTSWMILVIWIAVTLGTEGFEILKETLKSLFVG